MSRPQLPVAAHHPSDTHAAHSIKGKLEACHWQMLDADRPYEGLQPVHLTAQLKSVWHGHHDRPGTLILPKMQPMGVSVAGSRLTQHYLLIVPVTMSMVSHHA